ncbi:MAG: Ig-like domain-containing protein [Mycobacteriales bacterium]
MSLTNPRGYDVKGIMAQDNKSWTVAEPLAYNRLYKWSGDAVGKNGVISKITGSFTTVKPKKIIAANFEYINDGAIVGIGAPIMLQFHGPVYNKAAAQKMLKVVTDPPTAGSWSWLPPIKSGKENWSRVHWRPKDFWAAGTKVSVSVLVYGVDYGQGGFGATDMSLDFRVGRAQMTTADMQAHSIVVRNGNRILYNFPASFGLETDKNRITPVGTYLVMDKYLKTNFNNPRFGYHVKVNWATRLSNNGVFVHAYDKTLADQGVRNVSHGCINLSTQRATQFYNSSLFGDPVIVTDPGHQAPQLGSSRDDIYDWTVPWDQWLEGSALHK